jgi:hypothetical protein
VLATGPGNPPAVRVWAAKTGWFGSRPGQKPDLLTLGGLNLYPYSTTRSFWGVWLDLSFPISGSAFRVSNFMVTFRYATVNRKILKLVLHGSFLTY